MVDVVISSNNMKSPSPKFSMIFWDMTIYSDTLHWLDISLNRDLVAVLDLIADYDLITKSREVSTEHLQRVRLTEDAYSYRHLVL